MSTSVLVALSNSIAALVAAISGLVVAIRGHGKATQAISSVAEMKKNNGS